MKFLVYILYSERLDKFYAGYAKDVTKRLDEHNRGKGNFTAKGIPWIIVTTFPVATRAEAVQLELQIKKRGIRRYLMDKGGNPIPGSFGTL